jgi:hypothetical protein
VGHQAYQLSQTTTVPELGPDHAADSSEAAVAGSDPSLARLRHLSLVLILVGVLLLLLAVWR